MKLISQLFPLVHFSCYFWSFVFKSSIPAFTCLFKAWNSSDKDWYAAKRLSDLSLLGVDNCLPCCTSLCIAFYFDKIENEAFERSIILSPKLLNCIQSCFRFLSLLQPFIHYWILSSSEAACLQGIEIDLFTWTQSITCFFVIYPLYDSKPSSALHASPYEWWLPFPFQEPNSSLFHRYNHASCAAGQYLSNSSFGVLDNPLIPLLPEDSPS